MGTAFVNEFLLPKLLNVQTLVLFPILLATDGPLRVNYFRFPDNRKNQENIFMFNS